MKKFLTVFLLTTIILACRPEPNVEDIMRANDENISSESLTMQKETQTQEHIAEVHLAVPDSTWSIKIVNVTQTAGEIAVVCQLSQSDMMGLMVISEVSDAVKFSAKDLPVKYYIQGKTWNWENKEAYTFFSKQDEIRIRDGEPLVFEYVEPKQKGGPKKQSIGTPL